MNNINELLRAMSPTAANGLQRTIATMTNDSAICCNPDSYVCKCSCISFVLVNERNKKLAQSLLNVKYKSILQ